MADTMAYVRDELVRAGIVSQDVPPMFLPEAVAEKVGELDRLRAENTTLRALLPKLGAPCAYCGLTEIAKCAHGFPGCPQADDLMAGEDEAFRETVARMRAAEAEAEKWLAAHRHNGRRKAK